MRQTVVGDGRRPARTPLRDAQQEAGVPAGRWMGRGLAVLGLWPGQEVTETQPRSLLGERAVTRTRTGSQPIRLAEGDSPKKTFTADALVRRVMVTGVEFVSGPQPTISLLWALGEEETGWVIEAARTSARSYGCWSRTRTRSR
ncbi:relaxase domain-containing protein [Streptomyces sp. NPDC101160]|uniref:relaxase domain-containing protein n=1 Tax=Streptomyces sp. NPDC101160 TaxID=3366118 RepID=UPI00380391E1